MMSSSSRRALAPVARGVVPHLLVAACVAFTISASASSGLRFYPDDPLWHDPEIQDASGAGRQRASLYFDFLDSTFLKAGDRTNRRAMNVNTVDEVPDSSWFTNRIGIRSMSLDEIARGPDRGGPVEGRWTVISGKSEGISPGLVMRDAEGTLYFVKFDPPAHPELGSGAEIISTKIFHALGYWVPEIYIPHIRREHLTLDPGARITELSGNQRPMTPEDIDAVLARGARHPDGSYRIIAGKAVEGQPIGPFRYYGTRPDDPNDIFPHEHRRELRGLRVFAAWLAHNDLKSDNSLDSLVDVGDRKIVRHYLRDFNSTLGSSSIFAKQRREGNEHIWEARPAFRRILTLGLYFDRWLLRKFPDIPSVGHIEGDYFRPERWKPTYPQPALDNARADDTFWAARLVAAFSDEQIRAAVETARYTDPRATEYLTEVLIKRRNAIARVWLADVNPVVDFMLEASGRLTFTNAATAAGVATAPSSYRIRWFAYDNLLDRAEAVGQEQVVVDAEAMAPPALLASAQFVKVEVSADHAEHSSWDRPVHVYFRREAQGWHTVGLERLPE